MPKHQQRQHRWILIASIILTFLLSGITTLSSAQKHKANILLLSSYHVGYKWSDEIYEGTMDVLKPLSSSIALYTEFMDMKRNYSDDRFMDLYESFAAKYRDMSIDYVLSSDDTALIFLKKYGNELFPGATVVFCGTNYIQPDALEGFKNFFGITEKADIEPTLELMLQLHPLTQHIFIINEYSVTGRIVDEYIDRAATRYKDKINFIYLNDLPMEEILAKVRNLPDKSLIFFHFFSKRQFWSNIRV